MEEEVNKMGEGVEEPEIEGMKPNFTLGDVKEVSEGEKSRISDADYLMVSDGGVQSPQQKVSEVNESLNKDLLLISDDKMS